MWEPIETPAVVLHVPTPPSTNTLFVNVNGSVGGHSRAKGKKYRAWSVEAAWLIRIKSPPRFESPVRVLIEVDLPRQRDIDNAIKATLDVLKTAGVLADDNLVDDLRIVRRGVNSHAAISIWPLT